MWGAPTILEAVVSWVSRAYVTLIRVSSGPEECSANVPSLAEGDCISSVSLVLVRLFTAQPHRAASLVREPQRKPTGHRNAFRCDHGRACGDQLVEGRRLIFLEEVFAGSW
jgi:hypothetical protein